MKSTTFVLGAFLASVAIAQPHKQHRHVARHNKRDAVATSLAIVTDWVTETEIVGYTETIWVTPGFVEPEATSMTSSFATTTSSTSTTSTTPTSISTSTSQSAAQFFEPASTSSTQAPPKPTTTSSVSSSTPSPVYVAPTTSTASSVYVAPVESTSSIVPVVVPTTTTPAAVYTPPAETTTSSAVAATTTGSNSGSSSGTWSSSNPAVGSLTYYEAGLGACGETTDGSVDKVVALPSWFMGTQSNGNPYCGKTITISYKGKTTTATVVDKCPGCTGNHIDLSNAAFLELADLSVGNAEGAEWYFN